jgi:hypothetical protein
MKEKVTLCKHTIAMLCHGLHETWSMLVRTQNSQFTNLEQVFNSSIYAPMIIRFVFLVLFTCLTVNRMVCIELFYKETRPEWARRPRLCKFSCCASFRTATVFNLELHLFIETGERNEIRRH